MLSSTTRENISNTKKDIKLTASGIKEDVAESFDTANVLHSANEFAHETGRKARDYFESANTHLSDMTHKVNEEIHTNPVRSSLMALGMGFILGALLRR